MMVSGIVGDFDRECETTASIMVYQSSSRHVCLSPSRPAPAAIDWVEQSSPPGDVPLFLRVETRVQGRISFGM